MVIVLVGLAWLAVDDITTGNEPDVRSEIVMVVVTGIVLVVFGVMAMRKR